MRIGHAGLALIAKRVRPGVPLVVLGAAAYGPDILDGIGWITRTENPWISHSWLSVILFASLSAAAYYAWRRNGGDALAVWFVYLSHWPADYLTGNKPTWPGGPIVGLGLYDHEPWSWVVEAVVMVAAYLIAKPVLPVVSRRRHIS